MAKVSVIVPVYNVEQYIERCLNSLLKQTFQDFEIICVDDCSPDNSNHIIEKIMLDNPNKIKLYHNQVNSGLGKTRENGMKRANGDYIMFLDSDDFVEENWMAHYVEAIESHENLDMVIGGHTLADKNGRRIHRTPNNEFSIFMCPSACGRIYKRDFIEKNNLNFGGIRRSEDCYWTIKIALCNPEYSIIDDVGYYYWNNSTSITRGMDKVNNRVEEELELLHSKIFQSIDFSAITEFQRDMIEYLFISNTFSWLFCYNKGCGIKVMKEKYTVSVNNLKKYFPEFKKNSMLRFGKVKAGGFLCKSFVSVELFLYKIRLGKVLYYFRALI